MHNPNKPLYLHFVDAQLYSSIEVLEPFSIVTIYNSILNPSTFDTEAVPYLVVPGGVPGLPYLAGLAPAGTVVKQANGGTYLAAMVVVTESNLRPRWREYTPNPEPGE